MSRQPPGPTNVPGLTYPQVTTQDVQYANIIRNIYDNLFYLRRRTEEPKPLTPAQIRSLEQQLINQVTNNIVNNIVSTGLFITGTHNTRITVYGGATQDIGTGYFETDRNVIYIITDFPKKWEFAAGVMIGLLADQPTDLGLFDASFLFFASDDETLYIWDGTAWILISGGGSSDGYWAPVTNGDPDNPELVFDTLGNCVVSFTPTP
jgi:hypothetical protein